MIIIQYHPFFVYVDLTSQSLPNITNSDSSIQSTIISTIEPISMFSTTETTNLTSLSP